MDLLEKIFICNVEVFALGIYIIVVTVECLKGSKLNWYQSIIYIIAVLIFANSMDDFLK